MPIPVDVPPLVCGHLFLDDEDGGGSCGAGVGGGVFEAVPLAPVRQAPCVDAPVQLCAGVEGLEPVGVQETGEAAVAAPTPVPTSTTLGLEDCVFSFALFTTKPDSYPYYRESTLRFVAGMKKRFKRCRFVAHLHDAVEEADVQAIVDASGG